jgi:hypothetical protein
MIVCPRIGLDLGAVDKMIEVRYAGVVVGRSAIIRELDTHTMFLGITEPMPVGTSVVLRIGGQSDGGAAAADAEDVQAKVEVVSESQDVALAGMRVRFTDPRKATLFGTPGQAAPRPAEPVPSPTLPSSTSNSPMTVAAVEPQPQPQASPPRAIASTAAPVASVAPVSSAGIVVDASADRGPEPSVPTGAKDEAEPSPPEGGGDDDRIPAPDPSAFGTGGGGRRGRRNRRR